MRSVLRYALKHYPQTQMNNGADLMRYFSVPGKPVEYDELRDFWISLTFDECIYYRTASLY